jgi:hypothetical protein
VDARSHLKNSCQTKDVLRDETLSNPLVGLRARLTDGVTNRPDRSAFPAPREAVPVLGMDESARVKADPGDSAADPAIPSADPADLEVTAEVSQVGPKDFDVDP